MEDQSATPDTIEGGPSVSDGGEGSAVDQQAENAEPQFHDDRLALGTTPIRADAVAGDDVRDDPEFDKLETEFRKIETEGPNAVQWRDVAELSHDILANKSKDLMVGTWYTFALYREEGIAGFAIGLGILKGLIDNFWEEMYPPARRERGRVGVMEWLVGRAAPLIEQEKPTADDALAVLAAADYLSDIASLLDEKVQKTEVALGELIRALRPHTQAIKHELEAKKKAEEEQKKKAEAEQKAAEERAAQAAAAPPAAPAPAVAAGSAESPATPTPTVPSSPSASPAPIQNVDLAVDPNDDAEKAAKELYGAMRKIGAAFRKANTADMRPFLFTRMASLASLKSIQANDEGVTPFAPPAASQVTQIDTMIDNGRHQQAVQLLETMLMGAPYWLTGQYKSASALEALGDAHKDAHAIVCGMTHTLLLRFPNIVDLKFANGEPFADEAAVQWVNSMGRGGGGAGGASAEPADPKKRLLSEARALASQGKAADGLKLLTDQLSMIRGQRDQVAWQMEQAAFCVENKLVPIALSLLDHLDSMVDANEIETWDPELAGKIAETRCKALLRPEARQAMGNPNDHKEALERSRKRLARLNLAAAAKLPNQ